MARHSDQQDQQETTDGTAATTATASAASSPAESGPTTRDDANDLGVPMLPGSPDEPVGPEDALGDGPKRGDYRDRLGGSAYQPHRGAEPQKPKAEQIGDESGKKGGVETA